MKQPRTTDFDPSAREHELKSSMEGLPAIEHPPLAQPPDQSPEIVPPVRPVLPVRDAPSNASSKRKIRSRHPFDLYEDQIEVIKSLAIEERMRGGPGSQSAMVREALDDYIAKVRTKAGG
jgi:hypothetical protein